MGAGEWEFFTSGVTLKELAEAPASVRDLFESSFPPENIFDLTDEMEALAAAYLAQGVLTTKYADDARHVAACTVKRCDYLVSWNFRHLVNVQRAAGFNAVNLLRGYPSIRIVNPLELIYGKHDQDL